MERIIRKPFQGVTNIIRFNWHFYLIAFVLIFFLMIVSQIMTHNLLANSLVFLILTSTIISLVVSCYIYDFSDLYHLNWLSYLKIWPDAVLVNINAGFDETSVLLSKEYPFSTLHVFDFYDPEKHTEVSIERARKSYSIFPGTRKIETSSIPLLPASADYIFLILSAHEIRNKKERVNFFNGLRECLKADGRIIVLEHLRDMPNFLAYNFGYFHFYSKSEWQSNFNSSGLFIDKEMKITPFLSAFIIKKNGIAS